MPQFITSSEEFLIQKKYIDQIFDLNYDFPENMFNPRFKYFNGFEFDLIYDERFFNNLKSFLNLIDNNWFSFYTILPSAENYFLKHFDKYSVAIIDEKCSYDSYMEFLHTDPGNSPADALLHNAETIALYSSDNRWAIIGSKDCEIGIVGFNDKQTQNMFINHFDEGFITDVKFRINVLDEMFHFKESTREFYNKLESNYKDRL